MSKNKSVISDHKQIKMNEISEEISMSDEAESPNKAFCSPKSAHLMSFDDTQHVRNE